MILLAGGSGRLGSEVLARLRAESVPVRVLTRSAETAARLRRQSVDVVVGDVRDRAVTRRAVDGCTTAVMMLTGFGPGGAGVEAVDRDGARGLIEAAAERALLESGLPWTIIRPTAYVETHLEPMGAGLPKGRPAVVFGAGRMPIDFVAVRDVAALVVRAVLDDALHGAVLEIGGERRTMNELAEALSQRAGVAKPVRHVPRAALRVVSVAARPVSAFLARVAPMAIFMDTVDLGSPRVDARSIVDGLPRTPLDEVLAGAPVATGEVGAQHLE